MRVPLKSVRGCCVTFELLGYSVSNSNRTIAGSVFIFSCFYSLSPDHSGY